MSSWRTPSCPFSIEFDSEKLDDIRIAVVEAFYSVPRGGVEIAGVLFGKREEGQLLIGDYRKIETEYLTGPSFRLSGNDTAGLKKLLAETTFEDPGIVPLGWFISHTRSQILLAGTDVELYNTYFPEPWQVALVLKPDHLGTVRAGYFFRDNDGHLKTDAAVEEFVLERFKGERRELPPPPPEPVSEPVRIEASPVAPATEPVAETSAAPPPGLPERVPPKNWLLMGLLALALVAVAAGVLWISLN